MNASASRAPFSWNSYFWYEYARRKSIQKLALSNSKELNLGVRAVKSSIMATTILPSSRSREGA